MPAIGGHAAILLDGRYRFARKRAPTWALVSTRSCRLAGEWWPFRDFVEWPLSLRPQAGSYVGAGMHTVVPACRRWVGIPRFRWMAAIASPASGLWYPHYRVGAGLPAIGGHAVILLDGCNRFARKRAPTWRWYAQGRVGAGLPAIGGHAVILLDGRYRFARKRAPTWLWYPQGRVGAGLPANGGHTAISLNGRYRFAHEPRPIGASLITFGLYRVISIVYRGAGFSQFRPADDLS